MPVFAYISKERIIRITKNVLLPLAGFPLGWWSYTKAEEHGVISPSIQRQITLSHLKLQLRLQQLLPPSVVDKYGYPQELLQRMVETYEKGTPDQNANHRTTFDEVLGQCDVPEQIGFLEDHAAEDIPYFYIADIFHSWASLHRGTIFASPSPAAPGDTAAETQGGARSCSVPCVLRDNPEFDSELLCTCLWDKMVLGVVPFDVSVRALCVLAVNNRKNARRFAKQKASVETLLNQYGSYMERMKQKAEPEGDVVPIAEVTTATLFLLRAINDVSVHCQWIPFVGKASTGSYPLASRVNADQWCHVFATGRLEDCVQGTAPESVLTFLGIMNDKLRCNDRSVAG